MSRRYSRRTIVRGACGAAAFAAVGALLAACGGNTASPTVATAGGGGASSAPVTPRALGTPVPIPGALASGVDGVPDAFPKLPPIYKSTSGAPGGGGTTSYFCILFGVPPTPREQNVFWQEIEKRLGTKWEFTPAPSATYGEKVTALIAGGDLPDLCWLNPTATGSAGILRTIQQGAFTDLTPYLSGAALADYPNLARYPSFVWKNVGLGGKIYGLPKLVLRSSNIPFYRQDWAEKLGLGAPKNADDIYNMLVAFAKNDPNGNGNPDTYGLGSAGGNWNANLFTGIFRLPNVWRRNADGTLTNQIETPEYPQLVAFLRRLYAGGAYHPDAGGMSNSQVQTAWLGGQVGMHSEGYFNFWGDRTKPGTVVQPQAGAKVVPLVPVGFDGGAATTQNLPGFYGFTAIPAKVGKDPARVKQLLQIANYLAAPLGSDEWTFGWYGIEGTHHTVDANGDRIKNDRGTADLGGLVYSFLSEYRFYFPGGPGEAEKAQQTSKQILALGLDDPTLGYSSQTNNSKAAELTQLGLDRLNEIITGRAPLSALDAYIGEWKSRGGDQIRTEFQEAIGKA